MDHNDAVGRRLPDYRNSSAAADSKISEARLSRGDGVRRVRRMSNWTAAALVAGVAVTSGYFAHAATVAAPAAGYSGVGQHQPGVATAGNRVSLTYPVVTSGGSGATAGGPAVSGPAGSGGSGLTTVRWRDR